MLYWFAALCLVVLSSCSQQPQQSLSAYHPPEPTLSEITHRVGENWRRCVFESYNTTRIQNSNRNAAAEMAFQSCATEEAAVVALGNSMGIGPNTVIAIRARLKQQLLSQP
jgi:hypothetical protein